MNQKLKRYSLHISTEHLDRVMDVERRNGRSASDVVNSLLREYGDKLDESPSQPPRAQTQ